MSEPCKSLSVLRFGLAVGTVWGLGVLLLGLLAMLSGWAVEIVRLISSGYLGYGATLLGSFIGALWAFVDGFIGGVLLAYFYNLFGIDVLQVIDMKR